MKPAHSSISPFAYQTSSSSRSHRGGETQKTKIPHESRDTLERPPKKDHRTIEEGTSSGRGPTPHTSSASSLFSQQNITLEDIPALYPPSTPSSPKVSISGPVSISRRTRSTAWSPPQSLVKAVAPQAVSQQPTVEDDVEGATPTPKLVKAAPQRHADPAEAKIRPPIPAVAPAPSSAREQVPPRSDLGPPAPRAGDDEAHRSPLPSSSTQGSPVEAKSQPRRSLDDSVLRQPSISPPASATITATAAVSPPRSPRLHSYNPYNYQPGYMAASPLPDSQRSSPAPGHPQGMPPMSYGYMPMITGGSQPPMYANPYYTMPFPAPVEPMLQNNEALRSASSTGDEHQQLLAKVAGVLPDINRLLNNYRETHGQLSAKELLAKQADLSHNEQLSKVRVELEANRKEYEKVIGNLVGDRGKLEQEVTILRQRVTELEKVEAEINALRAEMDVLRVNKKELVEGFDAIRRSKEELQTVKLTSENEIECLKEALQAEKDQHRHTVVDVKEQAKHEMDLKQKEFHKIIDDHKVNYSKIQMELTSILSENDHRKQELDAARSSEVDQKLKLTLKTKELEDTLVRHSHEVSSIKKEREEGQRLIVREGEERIAKMVDEHSKEKKIWEQDLQRVSAGLESEKVESQRLRDKLERLRKSKDANKLQKSAELIEGLALWRTKSDELRKENQNLDRILQDLGRATEAKSKGNEFPSVSTSAHDRDPGQR